MGLLRRVAASVLVVIRRRQKWLPIGRWRQQLLKQQQTANSKQMFLYRLLSLTRSLQLQSMELLR